MTTEEQVMTDFRTLALRLLGQYLPGGLDLDVTEMRADVLDAYVEQLIGATEVAINEILHPTVPLFLEAEFGRVERNADEGEERSNA